MCSETRKAALIQKQMHGLI